MNCSFYTMVNWVCLNIFVAVLLENFEDNFETDLMELSQEDLDEFAQIFARFQDGDAHVLEGFVSVERVLIELAEASNPMGKIVDREVFWQNRIMFELDMNFEQAPGSMAAMRFDRHFRISEKDTKLAQKLGQLQPFIAVFPPERVGQLASVGPT